MICILSIATVITDLIYNHYNDLKDQLGDSKNLQKVANEDYSKEEDYMHNKSVDKVRTQYRMRTEILKAIIEPNKEPWKEKRKTEILAFSVPIARAQSTRVIARHIAFGAQHGQI